MTTMDELKAALEAAKGPTNEEGHYFRRRIKLKDGTELSCQDGEPVHKAVQGQSLEVAGFKPGVQRGFVDLPELGGWNFGVYPFTSYEALLWEINSRGGLA